MTPQDFDYLRKFLRERSGLVLAVEKQYLAESRLLPVVRRNGMSTLGELVDRLKNRAPAPLSAQVVEAMTTNETFFFRDKIPFDHFRDTIMPALVAARAREKRHSHLVHRGFDGPGALFTGDGDQKYGVSSRRLSHRHCRH